MVIAVIGIVMRMLLPGLGHQPVSRAYRFVLVGGCMFHWAHRFRYALVDLGVHGARGPIAFLCYGSAIAVSAYGGWVFFGDLLS